MVPCSAFGKLCRILLILAHGSCPSQQLALAGDCLKEGYLSFSWFKVTCPLPFKAVVPCCRHPQLKYRKEKSGSFLCPIRQSPAVCMHTYISQPVSIHCQGEKRNKNDPLLICSVIPRCSCAQLLTSVTTWWEEGAQLLCICSHWHFCWDYQADASYYSSCGVGTCLIELNYCTTEQTANGNYFVILNLNILWTSVLEVKASYSMIRALIHRSTKEK